MKMKRLLLLIPVLFLCRISSAQTEDLGMWMTASFNKGLVGDLQFNLDQEFRLRNNLSDVNLFYTNVGLTYKFTKWFRVSGTYRIIDKHKEDGTWGIRHRGFVDFNFKFKPAKFTIGYRARVQSEWRGAGYSGEFGKVPEIYVRNLFKFGYKLNDDFTPYIGTELRFQVQNPRIPYHDGFDRTRFMAGTDYQINKKQTLGLYFLLQKEWNVINPQTLYILGIEYSFSMD